jgi:hypothetical protein
MRGIRRSRIVNRADNRANAGAWTALSTVHTSLYMLQYNVHSHIKCVQFYKVKLKKQIGCLNMFKFLNTLNLELAMY